MSIRKLRGAGIAVAATVMLSAALSGSAQARATVSESPSRPDVKVPVAQNCDVPQELIKKGQQGLKGGNGYGAGLGPDVGHQNFARPVSSVGFIRGRDGASIHATMASTSWYDSAGKFQLRVVILPVKDANAADTFTIALVDNQLAEVRPPTADNQITQRTWKLRLTGRAMCVRTTTDDMVRDPFLYTSLAGDFSDKQAYKIPLPETTQLSQGRSARWEGEKFTIRHTNELSRLVAQAMNGKIKTGLPD